MTGVLVARIEAPLSHGMADFLDALHARCFDGVTGASWSAQAFRSILETPTSCGWLSRTGDMPGGLILARAAGGDCEILTFGVVSNSRRAGHGRLLMHQVAAWAHALSLDHVVLEVAVSNAAARAFYTHSGFVESGRRKAYYRAAADRAAAGRVDALTLTAPTGHVLSETRCLITKSTESNV